MTRRFRSTLLVLVMVWQTMLTLAPSNVVYFAQVWGHWLHHSESLQHHHHQDNTVHLEEAIAQSIDHVHIDSSNSSSGLEPSDWALVWSNLSSSLLSMPPMAIPFPHLEGPLRPPRHLV